MEDLTIFQVLISRVATMDLEVSRVLEASMAQFQMKIMDLVQVRL